VVTGRSRRMEGRLEELFPLFLFNNRPGAGTL